MDGRRFGADALAAYDQARRLPLDVDTRAASAWDFSPASEGPLDG